MRPGAKTLREAGRIDDIVSVRFAIVLFPDRSFPSSPCETVHAMTTVQNDWRHAATAPSASAWWDASGLDAAPGTTRWLATSDPSGRGPGFHLAVFPASGSIEDAAVSWRGIGTAGASPLPAYETLFGEVRGSADSAIELAAAPAWVTHWEPIISLRA
jgi:hypothetical protein